MKPGPATRARVRGIADLLQMTHDLDLARLAEAHRRTVAKEAVIAALSASLAARTGADDLSALAGNDAAWAAQMVVRQRAHLAELAVLRAAEAAERSAAERSFGRNQAFRGLIQKLEL